MFRGDLVKGNAAGNLQLAYSQKTISASRQTLVASRQPQ